MSPIVYSRTKERSSKKSVTFETPWVEADKSKSKPKVVDLYLLSGWDLFKFNSMPKIIGSVIVALMGGVWIWSLKGEKDDMEMD